VSGLNAEENGNDSACLDPAGDPHWALALLENIEQNAIDAMANKVVFI